MANPAHVGLISSGRAAFERWRRAAERHVVLDLAGATLTGIDLNNWNLSPVNLTGAHLTSVNLAGAILDGGQFANAVFVDVKLSDASCKGAILQDTTFTRVDLTGTDFAGASLLRASFQETDLRQARLSNASLEQLSLQGIDLSGCNLEEAKFANSNLAGAKFVKARLNRSSFYNADLTASILDGARLDQADCREANLTNSTLIGASLRNTNLTGATFANANFESADLFESIVDSANFDKAIGLSRARNVVTVRFENPQRDVRYFESAVVPYSENAIGWERIRWLGRLPLFGASYSALIAIPFLYYMLDFYNRKVDLVRIWAGEEIDRNGSYAFMAHVVLDHVHHEPIPALSELLLISTLLLGIGATIFAIACPGRIREFSRDQWRDQLGHSLIHYLPLSWRHRYLRIVCLGSYSLGGIGVSIVLISKIWNVFWFIAENR